MALFMRFLSPSFTVKPSQIVRQVQQTSLHIQCVRQIVTRTAVPAVCRCQNVLTIRQESQPKLIQAAQAYSTARSQDGFLTKIKESLGFTGKLQYPKRVLKGSGLRLYLCCVKLVDHKQFFEVFDLPDTFESWFRITELHIWMIMVRLAAEGKEGKLVRDSMINYMWKDVDARAKKLGGVSMSTRREQVYELGEQFLAAVYMYDEGLLSSDKDLAGAVWRMFFHKRNDQADQVEQLVKYIRKQIEHLDRQESGLILGHGLTDLLPLTGPEDPQRTKQILNEIVDRA